MIKSPRTGWTGKILHVDLEKQHCDVETPDTDFYRQTTGGKGMGGYYLRHFAGFAWDHPAMVLCLFTGPLTGTTAPTSGRAHLVTRSPLTGLIGDSSVGGKLATQLKRAGWDGIVITGKSKTPAGMIIDNDTVTFKDASELWGQDTQSVFRFLDPGKASLSCIGPAAENGVRFASVTTDRHHAAGRSGLGLSFACKNLKYILVNGTGRVTIHDPSGLKQAREEIIRLSAASPALMGKYGFTNLGTGAVFDLISNRRMMPTDNFKRTWFDSAGALNAPAYARTYAPEKYGCLGCHILCKKLTLKNGNRTALPEFETMSHFSALIGSRDLELVVEANTRCNTLGMDTISAASTLACRREITGEAFTPESLLRLLDDMAYGRGEGKLLALGSRAYAQAVGAPEWPIPSAMKF